MELIHTCYRIGDIDRSVAFYEALGFEERRRMPIRDEAINVFMGLPGDGDRLELTYNHGVDSYTHGTGYNHIAITVDDLDGKLARLAEQGIDAREAAVPGARGRLADLLRPRPGRLPDRDHRAPLVRQCKWRPAPRSDARLSVTSRVKRRSSAPSPMAIVTMYRRPMWRCLTTELEARPW